MFRIIRYDTLIIYKKENHTLNWRPPKKKNIIIDYLRGEIIFLVTKNLLGHLYVCLVLYIYILGIARAGRHG